ncbi:MAG: NAD(P)H-hydrate epimerase, partial [Bdellovibrionales bacterium]|nr:NAD(P)H-hydrate epimerase [Bdellovibrionales bacterium]
MKLLTSKEMAAADRATFERIGVPSRAVMESAGREVVAVIFEHFNDLLPLGVGVLCGGGNNGGDGYVIARVLSGLGVPVIVASIKPLDQLSGDAAANALAFQRLGGTIEVLNEDGWHEGEFFTQLDTLGLVIDALYGTGLRGSLRGLGAELVSAVNLVPVPVVAVDIASGVEADSGRVEGPALEVELTVALQAPKIGHVVYPGASYAGTVVCVDIGVPDSLPEIADVRRELLTEASIARLVQAKLCETAETHKGTRGHLLVLGGSLGHCGAAKMSACAALVC